MIKLFNIPNYTIDTSNFSSLLHDDIVDKFTENFLNYINMPYGCAVNSATSAIFLLAKYSKIKFSIPTMLPPVVENALIHSGAEYEFVDDPDWIGGSYSMNNDISIIDSAQEVKRLHNTCDNIYIYSFYPTKPIGSCDGGMIVSNNKDVIDFFKNIVYNGSGKGNWESDNRTHGWKMYMNSIQAYIANENLKKLDDKKHNLKIVRDYYNYMLGYSNISDHLYIIRVRDNINFIEYMRQNDIQCGIHYKCLHHQSNRWDHTINLTQSTNMAKHVVSIPFHENLTNKEIDKVIKCVKSSGMME